MVGSILPKAVISRKIKRMQTHSHTELRRRIDKTVR